MVGFEHFQLCHLHIQLHFLPDTVIPGSQGLDLGVGEGGSVHVLNGPGRGFPGHDLPDKFLLTFHQTPVVCVKGSFGNVLEHFNRLIHVALAQRTARPLLQISRTPWAVKVMGGHDPVLDVSASAHLLRTADEDAHLPPAHLGEQLRLLRFGVGIVDKGDFLLGDALGDQLRFYIVIDVKFAVPLGRGQVAEH